MKKNKQKKGNKNVKINIKILTISLLIILVCMIGFYGIYSQDKNIMKNNVKDYQYAMDINGARTIKIKLSSDVVDEDKKEENYLKAKKVIENRLDFEKVGEYNISLNKSNGDMYIEIPENDNTDKIVANLTTIGKFEIQDSSTNEVLINNDDIKGSKVLYSTTSSGTTPYLEIDFNKNGKKKLKDVSTTYKKAEETNTTGNEVTDNAISNDASENSVVENSVENNTADNSTENTADNSSTTSTKKIVMKIDDQEILTTSFDEPIKNGVIQLSVGSATTDTDKLNDYISQAQNVATVLDSGNLPVKYEIEKNQYILSDITSDCIQKIEITIATLVLIGIIILVVKYKINGLLAGISLAGLFAVFTLTIRYTNVLVSVESILGIAIIMLLDYILSKMILNNINDNAKKDAENVTNKAFADSYKTFISRTFPIFIIAIVFTFIKWIPLSSFGMIMFWGLSLIIVYNVIITKFLLKEKVESK